MALVLDFLSEFSLNQKKETQEALHELKKANCIMLIPDSGTSWMLLAVWLGGFG